MELETALLEAKDMRASERPRQAIDLLMPLAWTHPDEGQMFRFIGDCFRDLGQHRHAMGWYRKARKVMPEDEAFDSEIFMLSTQLRATYSGKEEVIDDPECRGLNAAGVERLGVGDLKVAAERLDAALERCDKYYSTWLNMALLRYQEGKLDEAKKMTQKALEINPEAGLAWYNLGTYFNKEKDWPAAIEALGKAVQYEPDDPDMWFNLGFAQYYGGDYASAETNMLMALEIHPDYANCMFSLARVYVATEDADKAIIFLTEMLRLMPSWTQHVATTEDFAAIRDHKAFQEMLTRHYSN